MAEFDFDLKDIFAEEISRITSADVKIENKVPMNYIIKIGKVIDKLGAMSALAQNLNFPITCLDRFLKTSDQTVYVLTDLKSGMLGRAIGFLKVGYKDLYLYDSMGNHHCSKKTPVVLDFFVHENYRRRGCGKKLFDHMLRSENLDIEKICVDRPSEKMLAFLKKNYNLNQVIPQLNNFVLYKGFFGKEVDPVEKKNEGRRRRTAEFKFLKI